MSEQHTPTPWCLTEIPFDNDGHPETVIGELNGEFAIAVALDFGKSLPYMRIANARRIVACVNACEGIPTDALIATCDDANDLKDFDLAAHALIERVGLRGELELARQQRDELLTALIQAKSLIESVVPFEGDTMRQIKAAIAKAEAA